MFESCRAYRSKLSPYPGEAHYLNRWVFECRWFSIRLHHWIGDDDQRNPHDHPWWFLSIVLWGELYDNGQRRRAPAAHVYPDCHTHTVKSKNAWTLLLTGPPVRKWGFYVNGEFIPKREYFRKFGHH